MSDEQPPVYEDEEVLDDLDLAQPEQTPEADLDEDVDAPDTDETEESA